MVFKQCTPLCSVTEAFTNGFLNFMQEGQFWWTNQEHQEAKVGVLCGISERLRIMLQQIDV